MGLPGGASSKETACQCRICRRCGFNPWAGKDLLEEDMATRSSILVWRIPWTKEPGGLQSMEKRLSMHIPRICSLFIPVG